LGPEPTKNRLGGPDEQKGMSNRPDLTLGEAQAAKLIDWRYLHAA